MAAHKKGQAFAGAYTHSRQETTPSTMHDEEGYLLPRAASLANHIEQVSQRTKDTISTEGMADGLSADLPKK
jgi:hypothetical protein